mgnify:CR=1 FL=1
MGTPLWGTYEARRGKKVCIHQELNLGGDSPWGLGSPVWQAEILPLDHRCLFACSSLFSLSILFLASMGLLESSWNQQKLGSEHSFAPLPHYLPLAFLLSGLPFVQNSIMELFVQCPLEIWFPWVVFPCNQAQLHVNVENE